MPVRKRYLVDTASVYTGSVDTGFVHTKSSEMNFASMVRTLERVQSRFQSKKRNRVSCPHGRAHDLTVVSVDS